MSTSTHRHRSFVCLNCGERHEIPVYCGDRFCPTCSWVGRRRFRTRLDSLVAASPNDGAYRWRHVVLTLRSTPTPREGFSDLVASFRRLRQRKFWGRLVRYGGYSVEVTGWPGSWHVHLHALVYSKWIPQRRLSWYWTACSGSSVVWVGKAPVGSSSRYLTKYVTDEAVPEEHRFYLSRQLSDARLYGLFGSHRHLTVAVKKADRTCSKCGAAAWFPLDLLYLANRIGTIRGLSVTDSS